MSDEVSRPEMCRGDQHLLRCAAFGHGPTLVELVGHPTVWPSALLAHAPKCLQAKKHIASSLRDLLREGMQMLTHALPRGGDTQLGIGLGNRQ